MGKMFINYNHKIEQLQINGLHFKWTLITYKLYYTNYINYISIDKIYQ